MSTDIGDLIFNSDKTLFEILDSLDVPSISKQLDGTNNRLDQVNDQLRQLGLIVDNNNANTTARFITVNTNVSNTMIEVEKLRVIVVPLDNRLTKVEKNASENEKQIVLNKGLIDIANLRISDLTTDVKTLSAKVNIFDGKVAILENTVRDLNINKYNLQLLNLAGGYIFSYRIGSPGQTWNYRISFNGPVTTRVFSNRGYPAQILSNIDGSITNRTVYLAAPFDVFSTVRNPGYLMQQGPCVLSFEANNTSPTLGYITQII